MSNISKDVVISGWLDATVMAFGERKQMAKQIVRIKVQSSSTVRSLRHQVDQLLGVVVNLVFSVNPGSIVWFCS